MGGNKILIVDDEPHIVELLAMNLRIHGYQPFSAYSGEEAIELVELESPELILLDLMLPGTSGTDVCHIIKEKAPEIPIIMLTAKSEEIDKIEGFKIGADDYVTKPFSIAELMARIGAAIRRTDYLVSSKDANQTKLKILDLDIDTKDFNVQRNGNTIILTRAEFLILKTLASKANTVVVRTQLLEAISSGKPVKDATLDVHIRNLRKKLEGTNIDYIKTVRGLGYLIETFDGA